MQLKKPNHLELPPKAINVSLEQNPADGLAAVAPEAQISEDDCHAGKVA